MSENLKTHIELNKMGASASSSMPGLRIPAYVHTAAPHDGFGAFRLDSPLPKSSMAYPELLEPPYAYDCSYGYSWVNTPVGQLRRCEFDGDGYMELSDSKLTVFEDWQQRQFSVSQILGMELGFKRLMAPMLIGGIMAPLSFAAAFNTSFNFWISIGSFFMGLLLFYYGVQGSHQVTVKLVGQEFKFFIDEKTEDVQSFIAYVNRWKGWLKSP